jgi:spermidine synthase
LLGWLLILVSGSGFAALIYEIVWLQQLQLVIGSSAVSLGLLLATYMGGLCLGSIAAPRMISAKRHLLWLYGTIELGIGILGLLILFSLPMVGSIYVSNAGQGFVNVVFRGIVCAIFLLPPTILMGMTFPILSRSVAPTKVGASRMGFIYAANIGGAVIGALCAGFYLLRVHDFAVATYAAVGINACAGLAGLLLAGILKPQAQKAVEQASAPSQKETAVYVAIGLSGFSALGAQIVWTRLLSVLFGATVYTFSIILAVFLIGLGIGSAAGSWIGRKIQRPRFGLAVCQMALAACIGWTAWSISNSLPYWPIDPSLALSPWFNFELDLLRTLWTLLPTTLLWGASFPLALAALASPAQQSDRLAGQVYGANTLGAIGGALFFSFAFVPRLGTMRSQQLLSGVAFFAALAVLISLYRQFSRNDFPEDVPGWRDAAVVGALLVAGVLFIATAAEIPWQLIAYGRRIAQVMHSDREDFKKDPIRILYKGEGLDSSLVITEQAGQRIIYVNGSTEASNAPDDMRLERMAGHLPALIHAEPQDVLIVGFGAGVTAGSFVTYPKIKKIVIAELESLIPPASADFFGHENYGVYRDARTRVVHDDGRHYLMTTTENFDVITSDPVHLYVKGTSALYSEEYFELVRRHLKPGGVIAQWLPLYDGDTETVKSVLATFFAVFPNGTVWSNHTQDRGYDLVLLGQAGPMTIDASALQNRLESPDYQNVVLSLRSVGFRSALDVLATYFGRLSDLQPWLEGAQLNLDTNLRLQYLAGFEINANASEDLYQSLLAYRRFPEGLFKGSEGFTQALRSMLEKPEGK